MPHCDLQVLELAHSAKILAKILEQLPYRSLIFNIDYGISEKNNDDIILYVEASSPIDRQYAIAQIKDWGFDPSLYSIVFSDFSNPLGLE